MRGTTLVDVVATLGVGAIVGSGSAPLRSQKETLRFSEGDGGNCGVGAVDGGCVGGAGDGVGSSMGDIGIQLEKMSRILEIAVSCSW